MRRSFVIDYLLNLSEHDLCWVASDFLLAPVIGYDVALQWVNGLSDNEVKRIWSHMEGEYKLSPLVQSQMEGE